MKGNLFKSLVITTIIVLVIFLILAPDPKGIGRGVAYLIGSIVFSMSGLVLIIFNFAGKLTFNKLIYSLVTCFNLMYGIILFIEFESKSGYLFNLMLLVPFLTGVVQMLTYVSHKSKSGKIES